MTRRLTVRSLTNEVADRTAYDALINDHLNICS